MGLNVDLLQWNTGRSMARRVGEPQGQTHHGNIDPIHLLDEIQIENAAVPEVSCRREQ